MNRLLIFIGFDFFNMIIIYRLFYWLSENEAILCRRFQPTGCKKTTEPGFNP